MRAPEPSPAEPLAARLARAGYTERERWALTEVTGFVRREVARGGWPLTLFFAVLLALLVLGGVRFVRAVQLGEDWLWGALVPLGLGIAATLLLVVPHEGIHGLGYRLAGARAVRFGGSLRALMFYATAPDFPLRTGALTAVALAPLVVIDGLLLLVLARATGAWWWVGYGALLAHTQGCIGDVAIVGFFLRQARPGAWISYDEGATGDFVLLEREPQLQGSS